MASKKKFQQHDSRLCAVATTVFERVWSYSPGKNGCPYISIASNALLICHLIMNRCFYSTYHTKRTLTATQT